MRHYIVRPADIVARAAKFSTDVRWCVCEAVEHGNEPIAYCHTSDIAERIARLLNDDEWRGELEEHG